MNLFFFSTVRKILLVAETKSENEDDEGEGKSAKVMYYRIAFRDDEHRDYGIELFKVCRFLGHYPMGLIIATTLEWLFCTTILEV